MSHAARIRVLSPLAILAGVIVLAGCGEHGAVEVAANLTAAASEAIQKATDGDAPEEAPADEEQVEPGSSERPTQLGKRTYFQYIDERGSVRFVSSRDELPPEWRDRAGAVELASAPPTRPSDRRAEFERRRARARRVLAQAEPARRIQQGEDVILYYATWCGYCKKAKKHLDANGVDYDLRNVDQPAIMAELKSKTGSSSIPVIDVGGELIRGYNPARMDQLIAAR